MGLYKGHFPLSGIFRAERHFLLFEDQLAESGRQKTKENIPRRKFRLVENGLDRRTSKGNNIVSHGEMQKTVDLKEPSRKEDNLIIKSQRSMSQSLTILMCIIRIQFRLSKAVISWI